MRRINGLFPSAMLGFMAISVAPSNYNIRQGRAQLLQSQKAKTPYLNYNPAISQKIPRSLQEIRSPMLSALSTRRNRMVASLSKLGEMDGVERDIKLRRESCYGCGAMLQTQDQRAAGFVPRERYELKRKHRQSNQMLCSRCQDLAHGKSIPGVRDLWAKDLEKSTEKQHELRSNTYLVTDVDGTTKRLLVSPEQLRDKLQDLKSKRSSVMVLLVDMLDASGSFLGRVRNLVGKNPVVLIGTKIDLLPPHAPDSQQLTSWLNQTSIHKGLRPISVQVVSSKTGVGMKEAINEMSDFTSRAYDPAAYNQGRFLPVESTVPGTTLGVIPLKAFETGGTLFDTPGVHLHHRLQHILTPGEVKEMHPRSRIKGYIAPSPGPGGAIYSWGFVLKLEVLSCPSGTQVVFYGPKCLKVAYSELSPDSTHTEEATPGSFGKSSIIRRGGMRLTRRFSRDFGPDFTDGPNELTGELTARVDVSVSGVLGWVAFYVPSDSEGTLEVQASAPIGSEVFFRPPMMTDFPAIRGRH
ncbi:hypothetical protein AAMO2058_000281500 [Amorphochlora amoebiformis]